MNRNDFFHLPLVINRWQSTPRKQMRLPQFQPHQLDPSEMSQLRFLGQEGTGLGNCRCFTWSVGSGLLLVSSLFLSSPSPAAGSLPRERCLGDFCEGLCWLALLTWAKKSWGYLDVYSGIRTPLRRDRCEGSSHRATWAFCFPCTSPRGCRDTSLCVSQVLFSPEAPLELLLTSLRAGSLSLLRQQPRNSGTFVCEREKEIHFRVHLVHIPNKLDLGKSMNNIQSGASISSSPVSPKGQGEGLGQNVVGGSGLERRKSSGNEKPRIWNCFLKERLASPSFLSDCSAPTPRPVQIHRPRGHPPSTRPIRPQDAEPST